MSTSVLSNRDHGGVARILNLPNAASDQEPATLGQVNALVEGLAWKDNARVLSTANLNLASPGATIDGVTMVTGNRVVVAGQTTASQNGIYIWNGAAAAMTRSLDANTADELLNATVSIDEGTNAGTTYRQTAIGITLGTTAINWVVFGASAPAATTTTPGIAALATQAEVDAGSVTNKIVTPATLAGRSGQTRKFAQTFGDGSATQFDITHNFNTLDVQVEIVRVSDGMTVFADVTRFSVNVVRLNFAAAPAASAYRVVIIG